MNTNTWYKHVVKNHQEEYKNHAGVVSNNDSLSSNSSNNGEDDNEDDMDTIEQPFSGESTSGMFASSSENDECTSEGIDSMESLSLSPTSVRS